MKVKSASKALHKSKVCLKIRRAQSGRVFIIINRKCGSVFLDYNSCEGLLKGRFIFMFFGVKKLMQK